MPINKHQTVVVLGTGGTIAGLSADAGNNVAYMSAQLGIDALLAVPGMTDLGCVSLETEQLAQVDSKDMDSAIWCQLALRCAHHLARDEVRALVITHGTDTMEETAYFLHRVLRHSGIDEKPVVLTGAMRPASSLAADGPQNLREAITVACDPAARGVLLVFASAVFGAADVQKVHTYRLDAFASREGGPLAWMEEGAARWVRQLVPPVPAQEDAGILERLAAAGATLPQVEIVTSHAGADGFVVDAMLSCARQRDTPLRGIVVAATGNGTMHRGLQQALARASASGVEVLRASRCNGGPVLPGTDDQFAAASGLTPAKARVALMLRLLTTDGRKGAS